MTGTACGPGSTSPAAVRKAKQGKSASVYRAMFLPGALLLLLGACDRPAAGYFPCSPDMSGIMTSAERCRRSGDWLPRRSSCAISGPGSRAATRTTRKYTPTAGNISIPGQRRGSAARRRVAAVPNGSSGFRCAQAPVGAARPGCSCSTCRKNWKTAGTGSAVT